MKKTLKLNLKSISDVVTNSSSEVFCMITGPEEVRVNFMKRFDDVEGCCGDGGWWMNEDDGKLVLNASYDLGAQGSSIIEFMKIGISQACEEFGLKVEFVDE